MFGLAIGILIASPASAGDLLKGEPFYSGIYEGNPIEIDPFAYQPNVRAGFKHSFSPYSSSRKINEVKTDENQFQHNSVFSEETTSGTIEFSNEGVKAERFTIERQFAQAREFVTFGNTTIVEGTVETYGAEVNFENYIITNY